MGVRSILNLPPGISSRDFIGGGTSGVAALIPGTTTVLKFPHGDEDECERCDREAEVYEHIKSSPDHCPTSLLRYRGRNEYGILLEYADHGPVRHYLRKPTTQPPEVAVILRWASQAAQAIVFLHANGIMHGDISCNNFFLNENLDLKVGDFTNSKIFSSLDDTSILKMDVFEFGLALYEMSTGIELYRGQSPEEKEEALRVNGFPDLSQVKGLGSVISRCWDLEFHTIKDILQSISEVCDWT
jgi:serine/threonine protein kinase